MNLRVKASDLNTKFRLHPQGKRGPFRDLVWKTLNVNLMWVMRFHSQNVFFNVYMDPIVKNSDLGIIFTSRNVFYFFFKKKTWSGHDC